MANFKLLNREVYPMRISMKKALAVLACFLSFEMQALEYEQLFDNDQVSVAKATIFPHEEIGLHRDVHPQIVVALKGGTITRLEADGRAIDVNFPTGVAVFRNADPENELHRSVNNSSGSIELMMIQIKNSVPIEKDENDESHDISINIKMNCPMSPELIDFVKSIPPTSNDSSNFDEWKPAFTNNMAQLIHLVESEKIFHASWSTSTDDLLSQDVKVN